MEELVHEIEIRRAKRALSEEHIPDHKLERIMTAATYAPSCSNNQPWRFVVVTERSKLGALHEALSPGNYWMKKAPAVVVVATRPDLDARLSDRREYALLGCGLATENLMLQAFKEGLIAHAIAGFDPLVVKKRFGIPEEYIVITLVALGYPKFKGGTGGYARYIAICPPDWKYGVTIGQVPDAPLPKFNKPLHWDKNLGVRVR